MSDIRIRQTYKNSRNFGHSEVLKLNNLLFCFEGYEAETQGARGEWE